MKKQKIKLILLLFAIIMMLLTIYFGFKTAQFSDTMSIKYQKSGLSSAQIDALNAKGNTASKEGISYPYVTGWDKTNDVSLKNTLSGSEQTATLLEIYGNMTSVYPCPLLFGSYLEKADIRGCVISLKTAEELFQSHQVIGCFILLGKEKYRIRGVLKSDEALIVLQSERTLPFPFLEFQYRDKQHAASNTKAMLLKLGLSEYESFLEGNFYGGVAYLFMGVPFLVLLCLFTSTAKNIFPNKRSSLFNCFKKIVIGSIFFLFLLILAKCCIVFSDDFIPSKISDFSFWTTKFKEVKADYNGILSYQTYYKEHWILHSLKNTVFTSLTSIILLFVLGLKEHKVPSRLFHLLVSVFYFDFIS